MNLHFGRYSFVSVSWVLGVVALLFAMVAAEPAPAGQCSYSDGTTDDGPCMEVRNELSRTDFMSTMNLWCHSGPTASTHKIVLRPNPDSFTCRGVTSYGDTSTAATVQRVQAGCNTCYKQTSCSGKIILKLQRLSSDQQSLYANSEIIRWGTCVP